MYSAQLTHADTLALRPQLPAGLRPCVDDLLNHR